MDLRPCLSFTQELCRVGLGAVQPSKSSPLLSYLTQGAKQRPRLHHNVCCGSRLCKNPTDAMIPLLNRRGERRRGSVQGPIGRERRWCPCASVICCARTTPCAPAS